MRLELFEKGPLSRTMIPWHQDTFTHHVGFQWTPELTQYGPHPVTLWVALDEVTNNSGGMQMVPGRHRELIGGVVPEPVILDAAAHGSFVEYDLHPGQAGLHHPLTPHRSMPNTTCQTRRAFLIRLVPWTRSLEEQCGCPDDLAHRAWQEQWPRWRSKPEGHFLWLPGDKKAM